MKTSPTVVPVVLSIVILLLHTWMYFPFMPDDTYISLQYVKRFVTGRGLTWTDDATAVEGYTNFLWVMILSIPGTLGLNLEASARGLGTAAMTGFIAFLYLSQKVKSSFLSSASIVSFFVATTGIIAAWSVGGLEQALVALLLAALIVVLFRWYETRKSMFLVWSGGLAGMLFLTRPDGLLFGAVTFVSIGFVGGRINKRIFHLWIFAAPLFLIVSGMTAFRVMYYDDYVPNTAHVKLPFSFHYLVQGLRYISKGYAPLFAFVVGAFGLIVFSIKSCTRVWKTSFLSAMVLSWTAYLVFIGGDVNPPSRHFVPVVVLLAFMSQEFLSLLFSSNFAATKKDVWVIGSLLFFVHCFLQIADVELKDARGYKEISGDARAVAELLNSSFGDRDLLIALDGAGMLPYMTEFRFIDMLGLNDYHIARHRPESFGSGWLGHELGDPVYVLNREPDMVLFGSYRGQWQGAYAMSKGLLKLPLFRSQYQQSGFWSLSLPRYVIETWIHKEGALGVKRRPGSVQIPPWLLGPQYPAIQFPDGSFQVEVTPGSLLQLPVVELEKGMWEVAVLPEGLTDSFQLSETGSETIKVEDSGLQNLSVAYKGTEPVTIGGFLLRRIPE